MKVKHIQTKLIDSNESQTHSNKVFESKLKSYAYNKANKVK